LRDLPPAKAGIIKNAVKLERTKGANITDLTAFFDSSKYLTNYSDIVALMVLGHQVFVENQMTELNLAAKKAIYDSTATNTLEQYKAKADALVDALLLVGE